MCKCRYTWTGRPEETPTHKFSVKHKTGSQNERRADGGGYKSEESVHCKD